MELVVILLICLLLCGGWGYNRRGGYVTGYAPDLVFLVIVLLILGYFLGWF